MARAGFRSERVFVLAAILLVGLALTLAIQGPDGSGTLGWVMSGVLVLVAGAGSIWLRRGSAGDGEGSTEALRLPLLRLPLDVVLPGLLVGGFALFLRLFGSGAAQAGVLVLAGIAFAGVLWAQAHTLSTHDPYFGLAQSALSIGSHLAAFLLYSTIYGLKARALVSASAVGFVTALLLYELLSRDAAWHRQTSEDNSVRRGNVLMLSLAAGFVAAELTWGLNYWAALTTLVGGAFLLVVYYVEYGLLSAYAESKLTRQTALEYGAVAVVALIAVFVSAFFVPY